MTWERRRHWPAMAVATIALVVALGGSVYAATRIDGHTVKVKSLPGNRLVLHSVPANRLRPGTIPGNRLEPGSVTGHQVDAGSLGEVPEATRARSADAARRAGSALVADSADEAQRLNGHSAACASTALEFAGACWETAISGPAVTAPEAAAACAERGGELPAPLTLVAFAKRTGTALAAGGEWTNDIISTSGEDIYSLATLNAKLEVDAHLSNETQRFRCVIPLLT